MNPWTRSGLSGPRGVINPPYLWCVARDQSHACSVLPCLSIVQPSTSLLLWLAKRVDTWNGRRRKAKSFLLSLSVVCITAPLVVSMLYLQGTLGTDVPGYKLCGNWYKVNSMHIPCGLFTPKSALDDSAGASYIYIFLRIPN